eukprot:2507554-Pyramimonas_sp.AAC.1
MGGVPDKRVQPPTPPLSTLPHRAATLVQSRIHPSRLVHGLHRPCHAARLSVCAAAAMVKRTQAQ